MAATGDNSLFYWARDEYGKVLRDPVPPNPLAIARVMQNHRIMSNSTLFKLPTEILELIVGYVEWSSLARLALVNRDCRQLARSRQFAGVYLDYSHTAEALLSILVFETAERRENNGSTVLPSLGACIRRLTVSTNTDLQRQRFNTPVIPFDPYGQRFHDLTKAQLSQCNVANRSIDIYHRLLLLVLGSSTTLPNLEVLDWEDNANLPPTFFSELACSTIQHLKLYRPRISQEYDIVLPLSHAPRAWQLRTLHLDIVVDWSLYYGVKTARLCASILRLCAPTLEALVWSNHRREDTQTFDGGGVPCFPRLRYLRLESSLNLEDPKMVDAFLHAKLSNLAIRHAAGTNLIRAAMIQRGHIPSLSVLTISKPPLEFLQCNIQLSKIDFSFQRHTIEEIEQDVLPLLSTFPNLVSLRLFWPETCVLLPEEGLRLLGKLQNLKQLCISCGVLAGWRRTWHADHEAIRKHLSPLKKLQKLVLRRDTYETDLDFSSHVRYYQDTYATRADLGYPALPGVPIEAVPDHARGPLIDAALGKPFWEAKHLKRVNAEAMRYAEAFPALEWIYVGERAVTISTGNNNNMESRQVVSIVELEDESKYFENMFGE